MTDLFKGKNILVTGGTGSIGSEIVKHLLPHDFSKIIIYSIDEIEHYILNQTFRDNRLDFVMGDIRDERYLNSIFARGEIDYVYHAAALKHVVMCEKSPIEPVKTNILGTQNLIDKCLEYNVEKMIFISTDKAVYPTTVMGATKFIAERLVQNAHNYAHSKQAFSCIRFGNIANTRGSVIPIFILSMLDGKPILVTDPRVTRFAIRMADAINMIFKATQEMKGGEIFILKMRAFRLGDLIDALRSVAQKLKLKMPEVKEVGLYSGEKLHEDLISELELPHLYENKDMFVIIPPNVEPSGELKKANINVYNSSNVEVISKTELEQIILEYVRNKDYFKDISL